MYCSNVVLNLARRPPDGCKHNLSPNLRHYSDLPTIDWPIQAPLLSKVEYSYYKGVELRRKLLYIEEDLRIIASY